MDETAKADRESVDGGLDCKTTAAPHVKTQGAAVLLAGNADYSKNSRRIVSTASAITSAQYGLVTL